MGKSEVRVQRLGLGDVKDRVLVLAGEGRQGRGREGEVVKNRRLGREEGRERREWVRFIKKSRRVNFKKSEVKITNWQ